MSRWRFAAAMGFLVVSPEPALAADDDTTKALLACAAESDDARRLRCFDTTAATLGNAAANKPAPATSAATAAAAATGAAATPSRPQPAAGASAATAPTGAAAPSAPTVAGTSGASTPTVAAAPAAPPTTLSPEERFGRRKDPQEEKKDQLTELTASVTALGAKPHGELVITLDNGQVWTEIAPGSKIRLKPGDSVTIEAGTLGSFILIAPNKRSSKVSRVR